MDLLLERRRRRNGTYWTQSFGTIPNLATDYGSWLAWKNRRVAQFEVKCPINRSTQYYFSQSGDDTTGDGSQGNPWKTKTKANSVISALTGAAAFLFNRGDTWEDTTPLVVNKDNVTIAAYGTGDKPLFNAFTSKIPLGSVWTLVSGNIYKISVANVTIGAVRPTGDRLYASYGNVWAQASNATGAGFSGTLTDPWWFNDTTADELYINLGGDNPTDYDIEYLVENTSSGIFIENVDGTRIDNMRIDGFSFKANGSNHNAGYNIMSTVKDGKVAYITNNDCYFGSAHIIGHLVSGGSGGIVMFRGNKYGLAGVNLGGGETLLNFYEQLSDGQFYDIDNTAEYGTIPNYTWDFETRKARGTSFYCHTSGGSNKIALAVSYGNRVKNSIQPAAIVGCPQDVITIDNTLANARRFVVKAVQEELSTSARQFIWFNNNTAFHGCQLLLTPQFDPTGALWAANTNYIWWINSILSENYKGQASTIQFAVINPASSGNTFYSWNSAHNRFNFGSVSVGVRMGWSYDDLFDGGPTPSGNMIGSEFVNSIDTYDNNDTDLVGYLSLDNRASQIRNSAFFGHTTTTSNNTRSYNNGANVIELSSPYNYTLGKDTLEGAGESGLVSHDFYENARVGNDIGPVDFTASSAYVTDSLVLDNFNTPPALVISLRRMTNYYTGPLIRVRRSSDNAEQDIGYDSNGDLDTAALLSFVGANNGFVTTWYDQSIYRRNLTQTTAAQQPQIVTSGVVEVLTGTTRPALVSTLASSRNMRLAATSSSTAGSWHISVVGYSVSGANVSALVNYTTTASTTYDGMYLSYDASNTDYVAVGSTAWVTNTPGSANVRYIYEATSSGGTGSYTRNGTVLGTQGSSTGALTLSNTSGTGADGIFRRTTTSNQGYNGRLSEYIAFYSAPVSGSRTVLRQNQGSHFTISV